jgi:uncharacterized protein YciI
MFIALLEYLKPLSDIDPLLGEHREFLERRYASGHFLLSGRKEPRTGGVILLRADSRAQAESILREDSFQREGVARFEIVEFLPSMAAPPFESLGPWATKGTSATTREASGS